MSQELTFKFHVVKRDRGRVELKEGQAPVVPPREDAPSRIARLMALAIKIEALVREGQFRDFAEVAVVAGLTRARISQINNLTTLAPDIQERLLFMKREPSGKDLVNEHNLRTVTALLDWPGQRVEFERVLAAAVESRRNVVK